MRLHDQSTPAKLKLLVAMLLVAGVAAEAQTGLQRRFNNAGLADRIEQERDAPLYASPEASALYFENYGEWIFEFRNDAAFDSNVFEDGTDLGDWRWEYEALLTYDWWANESAGIVLAPTIGIQGQRFDDYSELDGDILGGGLAVTFKNFPIETELAYAGAWGFESGFGEHHSTEHAFEIKTGGLLFGGDEAPAKPSMLWQLSAGYVDSDPEPLSYAAVGGALEFHAPLTDQLELIVGAGLQYQDYTDSESSGREAWVASLSTELAWELTENAAIVGGVAYLHSDDDFPDADYEQFVSFLSLRLNWEGFRFLGLPKQR